MCFLSFTDNLFLSSLKTFQRKTSSSLCSADFVSGGESVFILSVAVIGLSRQSHDFDENKQLNHESAINFPLIERLFS